VFDQTDGVLQGAADQRPDPDACDTGPANNALSITVTGRAYTLAGDLDLTTAPVLGAALDDALDAGCREIRLGMAQVRFLTCAGLRPVLRTKARLYATGGRLVLDEPSRPVLRVLCLVGLCQYLDAHADAGDCPYGNVAT
jgi:anti-anti-sigma factor